MQLWSDPTPSNETAAALSSKSMVQAPGIGGLVSAILEDRYRKQQQQQAMIQNITKTLGDAYTGYQQNNDAGTMADYMQQSREGPPDDNSLAAIEAKLSPQGRLKLEQWNTSQQDQATKEALNSELIRSRINADSALANQRWTGGGGADVTPGQTATANRELAKVIREDLGSQFGTNPDSIRSDSVHYGSFDAQGNWVTGDKGDQAMIGNPITTHVPGTPGGFHIPLTPASWTTKGTPAQDVPTSYSNVFPRKDAERALMSADQYRKLMENGGLPGGPTMQPNTGGGWQPAKGTKKVINGKPATWDGYGWVAD